jgi:sugar (pentulose or hexulose) kinase
MAESLVAQIQDPQKRSALVDDAVSVLENEVRAKGGMSGLAIKGAFKLLTSAKPGFVRHVVDAMLDEFLEALDPLYQEAISAGQSPGSAVRSKKEEAARALLQVADRRVAQSENQAVKKTYGKLRGSAEKQVVEATPALGQLLDRHAGAG